MPIFDRLREKVKIVYKKLNKKGLKRHNQFNGMVYAEFSDVPSELIINGYASDKYAEYFFRRAELYSKETFQDISIAKLIVLINLLSSMSKIEVLDYGGSVGQVFWGVEKYLSSPNNVKWNVLDVAELVSIAKEKYKSNSTLSFYTDVKKINKIDILFFRQALQFFENYQEALKETINSFQPKVLYFCGVTAGQNKEYKTLLCMEGNKGLPVIIFNEEELIEFVKSIGFIMLEKFNENARIDLSNFKSLDYQLDSNGDNFTKGYIFIRKDNRQDLL
ncbi:MAG: hypothetical protein FD145_89 [Candidatus Saganbacteria bacterium]|uniref:Methyltransferase, TIGR04325 family n=1 Tax=Candidatus Saganbacteria bacterium TaxID=2575572 RepID=A0A833L2G7_UNCSA|nr:MAG: hypothetical protein FD145_89 [Candidatus Saganbacteria bacterium]